MPVVEISQSEGQVFVKSSSQEIAVSKRLPTEIITLELSEQKVEDIQTEDKEIPHNDQLDLSKFNNFRLI